MNSKMITVIKELRLSKNLTQKELADKLNMTQRAYSFYETGRNEPNIDTLIRLADIFGVSLDILTGRYIKSEK